MTWILIFWIGLSGRNGGPATAEFNNKGQCERALAAVKAEWSTAEGMCVMK